MFFTTCGWMMWNWLVSVLSSKAKIVLYDGSPFYPNKTILFDIIEKEEITFFGVGAKYIDTLKNEKIKINKYYKLKKLRTFASTGSPLSHESFKYVYNNINKNIHLASISGGTDIVSCFVLGNPKLNVYSGEIQCKGLGMDVDVYNEKGESIIQNNKLYNKSYFSKYKNIWQHGDYAEITKNKGIIIHGRSDTTLNSGGIRIGTSEIYRIVENIRTVNECLVTEFIIDNDTKMIMFVKLLKGSKINEKLIDYIKKQIKNKLSPKHVPSKIIQVKDIPKTKTGKIVELAVKNIINGKKVENIKSLSNPESLKDFTNRKELVF